jgi:hypothetical protein
MVDLIMFRRTASLHILEISGPAGSAARVAASPHVAKLAELIEKGDCCGF